VTMKMMEFENTELKVFNFSNIPGISDVVASRPVCAVGGVCGEEVGKVQGADYYASGDCACNNVHIIYAHSVCGTFDEVIVFTWCTACRLIEVILIFRQHTVRKVRVTEQL